MAGTRSLDHRIRYLVDAVAAARGASVSRPTTSPEEAYADRPAFSRVSAPPPFAP
jgi:LPS O-antigen subunit length determinant protein (WzzB/FepE family)